MVTSQPGKDVALPHFGLVVNRPRLVEHAMHLRPTKEAAQHNPIPTTTNQPCEDCARLLDTVHILHDLVFELRHDMADMRFKMDLMDRRGGSV
jgi:hypothetical protein